MNSRELGDCGQIQTMWFSRVLYKDIGIFINFKAIKYFNFFSSLDYTLWPIISYLKFYGRSDG